MRGLSCVLLGARRRLASDDEGLAAVFVAVVLIALIAMVAFAVDVGALYAERRELQSGADAAVLAIAEDCAVGLPCDTGTATVTANEYAAANARDLLAGIDELILDTTNRTVSVITRTEEPGGSTIFAPFFAQVIGFEGTKVGAHASATWDYPRRALTLPLIVSDCEWDLMPKPEDVPPNYEYIFKFHDSDAAEPCNASPGKDQDADGKLPGGFGWLATGGSDCEADLKVGNWIFTDTGSSPSNGCEAAYFASQVLDQNVIIPYFSDFDGVDGSGAKGGYWVSALGAFHVTGYSFGGQFEAASVITGAVPCTGNERCIAGYPVYMTISDGEPGGEDRGLLLVKLTG